MKLSETHVKSFYRKYAANVALVMVVREHAAAERAKVDAYIEPLLVSFDFKKDLLDGSPITKSSDLYLSEDKEGCAAFYAACDEAHKANGYELEPGYCPALIAKHAVVDAENALLKVAAEHFAVPFDGPLKLKLRAQALDLILNPPFK